MSSQSTSLPNCRVFSQEGPPECKSEPPLCRALGNTCDNDNTVTSRALSSNALAHAGRGVGARLHTAAQSVTAGDWEQPNCPSGGNWFDELWSIYTGEHSAVVKKWRNHLYADVEPSLRETVEWKEQGVDGRVNGKVREYINILSRKCIKMSRRIHEEMIALVRERN